ncbi:SAV_2336 N-terminal domain-related protein [Streptomyces sp. NPDC051907]|uniref:SAV_2336 N-terminal domain-related protein n=1 Tax=Streptomyces sp. NPDC051907 TaxID=3155284 RepID=UPI003412E5CB
MDARPLAVQRAMRPLRRTVAGARGWELDEAETAHRIAALGARRELWLPVLRPRRERWLHLRFVLDAGPTMTMWRPLLRDLRTALAQTGAFRTVDTVALGPDGAVPHGHWERGRTAVLVVSDCMGPQWRAGPAGRRWYGTLRAWTDELPVAVVQPLPERLWQHTAFPPRAGMLAAPGPGAANAALDFVPYEWSEGERGAPVPVLEPSPSWLGNWASLLASSGGTRYPGSAARALPRPPEAPGEDALDPDRVEPEELVLRFRSLASPQAFRLAAHLAVGTAHLPVMRLVQAAIEEHPEPRHLAEVVLSGMLRTLPDAPAGSYDFRPGVREVLLGTLPRTSLAATTRLLGRVSAQIESRAGAVPGEFRALVAGRGGGSAGAPMGDPFALVSPESVRLLRGPETVRGQQAAPTVLADRFELRRRISTGAVGEVWAGYDTHRGHMVCVKSYRFHGDVSNETRRTTGAAFVARAYQLADSPLLRSPHLAAVYDGFMEGDSCYLVMELVEGDTLQDLLARSPSGLRADRVTAWGRDLLAGLDALHAAGYVHGDVKPANILLSAERGPVLCDYGVEWSAWSTTQNPDATVTDVVWDPQRTRLVLGMPGTPRYLAPERIRSASTVPEIDLYSLGCVLYEMLTGTYAFAGQDAPRVFLAHLAAGYKGLSPQEAGLPEVPGRAVLELLAGSGVQRRLGADRLRASTDRAEPPRAVVRRRHYRVLGSPLVEAEKSYGTDTVRPEHRSVLARLLLARGAPVPEAELRTLAEEARVVLEDAVGDLQAQGHLVYARDDGFALDLERAELDIVEAEQCVQAAEAAQKRADPALAVLWLERAFALWNDVPLAEVPGDWAWERRQAMLDWRASLTAPRDELLRTPASYPGSVWIVMELAPPPGELRVQRYATSLEASASLFFKARLLAHQGRLGDRASFVIRLEVPRTRSVPDVLDWALQTLPQEVPRGAGSTLLRVLVAEWNSEIAQYLPLVQESPYAALCAAVNVSEAVAAQHPPGRGFLAVRGRMPGQSSGRQKSFTLAAGGPPRP